MKLMLFLTEIRSEFSEEFRCHLQKLKDIMLNADVSDGVFYSKFGDGNENFQDCLENSDQNSLRILILTEFYKKS